MADDRLDRGPSTQLAFDGRRPLARALGDVDFRHREPCAPVVAKGRSGLCCAPTVVVQTHPGPRIDAGAPRCAPRDDSRYAAPVGEGGGVVGILLALAGVLTTPLGRFPGRIVPVDLTGGHFQLLSSGCVKGARCHDDN